MVDTIATVCATGKTFLCSQFFLSPCDTKDSEKVTVKKTPFSNRKQSLFTSDKRLGGCKQMRGCLGAGAQASRTASCIHPGDLYTSGLIAFLLHDDADLVQGRQLPQQPHSHCLVRAQGHVDRRRGDEVS
jgi:hypothetical protein